MGDTSAEDGAGVAEEAVSRSKHGRRRGLWKQSSPCDCWICMPVAEKKEKLLRRVGASDLEQQINEYDPAEDRAMKRLEAWEDANPNWRNTG